MKSDKLDRDKWMKLIKSEIGLSVECGARPKEELLIELPKAPAEKEHKSDTKKKRLVKTITKPLVVW